MTIQQTPTRRSQRFQPTATPLSKSNGKNILECAWVGEPIYKRKTNPQIDFLQEEEEERKTSDGDEEQEDDDLETVFYDAFKMSRKATAHRPLKRLPVGKTELETYRVGDTVMVETNALYIMKRPPSIGVIVALWETRTKREDSIEKVDSDASKMRVRIHWFLRPSEMASIRAKREHDENEIYYCLTSRAIITPGVILSPCSVSSVKKAHEIKKKERWCYVSIPATPTKPKRGSPKKPPSPLFSEDDSSSDPEENLDVEPDSSPSFYCHLAIDSQRGVFYGFDWEDHRKLAMTISNPPIANSNTKGALNWGLGEAWDVQKKEDKPRLKEKNKSITKLKTNRRQTPKKSRQEEAQMSESEVEDSDDYEAAVSDEESDDAESICGSEEGDGDDMEVEEPRSPSRKRKRGVRSGITTPRKSKRAKSYAEPTPHSKAALRKRANASPRKRKVYPIRIPDLLSFQSNFAHLPKDPWLRSMHALHVGNRPDALPCRDEEFESIRRSIGQLLEEGSGGCIYISGVPGTGKTATIHSVVKELKRMAENSEISPFTYVEINGLKIPEPSAAYNLLWEGITRHDVAKEGRLRLSSKESLKALMRYFTTGNRGPGDHACVVLMDELDQLVTTKQDVVYNFFNWPTLVGSKLVVIAVANTMDLPERVMNGRVRSRLGMVRINFQPYSRDQLEKIVEARLASAKEGLEDEEGASNIVIAKDAIKLAAMAVSRITGDARRILDICRRAVEMVQRSKTTVKAPQVKEVLQALQNSPTAAYLRELSLHERLMLASLIKCVKREGVEEIKWSEVQYQHLTYTDVLTPDGESRVKPTAAELTIVLDSLVASRAVVLEDGARVARKADGERRLLLNIEQGEVERVLGDVGGPRWKGVLST